MSYKLLTSQILNYKIKSIHHFLILIIKYNKNYGVKNRRTDLIINVKIN